MADFASRKKEGVSSDRGHSLRYLLVHVQELVCDRAHEFHPRGNHQAGGEHVHYDENQLREYAGAALRETS